MYGSVLSGGLAGHVHGTAAYDLTTTGEPAGARPHVWEALKYESGEYMRLLREFVLSEGAAYQALAPAREDVDPHKAPGAPADGLDGWAYMMRTPARDLALLYFEHGAVTASLRGFTPGAEYVFRWYHPSGGTWAEPVRLRATGEGVLRLPDFPPPDARTYRDWAARIIAR